MKREPVLMTPAGVMVLEGELWDLRYRLIPEIADQLRDMRGVGEGGEYRGLLDEQLRLRERLAELQLLLGNVMVLEPRPNGRAQPGSWVVLRHDDSGEEHYRLVGTAEADPARGYLSISSPLGRAAIGHRSGDEVRWRSPDGAVHSAVVVEVG
ncbi:MAG TPA: GreA/GreB family elongation factor [Candidatus Dormibacteraeota bacterium]|jgi:transcription elongation GreA/GreB family factor|nr:GreA/GreB family elongation factor [Candidatus Dormibacteraeota bacterium]